jgi:sugar phosphate isomerase/epimerase
MSKISFTTMGTPDLDGPQSIQLARKCGFDGIDLRVSDHKGEIAVQPSASQLKDISTALDGEGIELVSLFAYNERGTDDPESWQKMEDSLLEHLDIAASLNCPAVRMFGGDPQVAKDANDHIKRTAEVLKNIFRRHDSNIQIRLQNHQGSFLFTQGRQLFDLVDDPRFSQVFSPDHCFLMNEDLDSIFKTARESTSQIFISDLIKTDDKRGFLRTEIGEGDVPLIESIQCLGEDFNGYITLKWEKIWNAYLAEPEEAFPRFMEWMAKNGLKG